MKCKLCEKDYKLLNHLSSHIRKEHSIELKDYYDKYLKVNEGKCLVCNKETNFISLGQGYNKHCSKKCTSRNSETKNKKLITRTIEKVSVDENKLQFECKICNKKLISIKALSQHLVKNHKDISIKEYYDKFIKKENEGICPICNKETSFFGLRGYQRFCSQKCSQSSEYRLKNFKNTLEENNSIEKAKEKRIATNLEKFGKEVVNQFDFENRKEKYKEIVRERNKLKFDLFLKDNNIKIISEEKYDYYSQDNILKFKCLICNYEFEETSFNLSIRKHKCPSCRKDSQSITESELRGFVKELLPNELILFNDKTILRPKELDIYIPSKNIAIEYCGLYWHSEKIIYDKNYHFNKLISCKNQNIKLIQIFEDEWIYKNDIVKEKLRYILNSSNLTKIGARECIIKEINQEEKTNFLNTYHIQGSDYVPINLGAFYNNELVSVMTFGHGNAAKNNISKDTTWELSRFCSNSKYLVQGIASKLLEYFKTKYKWEKIFSYSDRRWSEGNLYYNLGFELEKENSPSYWFSKDGLKRYHRSKVLKRENNDPNNISIQKIVKGKGYYKIWDCGNLKFIIKNNSFQNN